MGFMSLLGGMGGGGGGGMGGGSHDTTTATATATGGPVNAESEFLFGNIDNTVAGPGSSVTTAATSTPGATPGGISLTTWLIIGGISLAGSILVAMIVRK